ncbi:MAG: 4'-phosphopantetheinyl transferase family protein [Shewanella sp.]
MANVIQGPSAALALAPSPKISLFFIPLGNMEPELQTKLQAKARAWLSEDERAKIARYRAPKAQMQALLVRAALRTLLSRMMPVRCADGTGYHPKDWCFEYGPKGKPALIAAQREETGLEFNLSHSGEWLLIGVLHAAAAPSSLFGVDIERSRPKTHIDPILHHYFSAQEQAALRALSDVACQRQRFFDLWALKESYIKATGLGLAQSLQSFRFDLAPTEPADGAPMAPIEQVEQAEQAWGPAFTLSCDVPALWESGSVKPSERLYPCAPILGEALAKTHQWQSYLGRLNPEYRFAISLGQVGQQLVPAAFEFKLCSIHALLAAY